MVSSQQSTALVRLNELKQKTAVEVNAQLLQ
jgi:hypothetical protein